jgi:hypothetical protein
MRWWNWCRSRCRGGGSGDSRLPLVGGLYAAGTRRATEWAEFTDLDAMTDVARTVFVVTPYLLGFLNGAAASADVGGNCFARTA